MTKGETEAEDRWCPALMEQRGDLWDNLGPSLCADPQPPARFLPHLEVLTPPRLPGTKLIEGGSRETSIQQGDPVSPTVHMCLHRTWALGQFPRIN